MPDEIVESFSDCARGECDHLSDGQRAAAREMERSQSDEIEKAEVVNKVSEGDVAAWILFHADKDVPILHREGLPGLTHCGGFAFAPMFGAITVGRARPNAPICEGCKTDG